MNIHGQTAIVTGAASGLGKATAQQLAQRGARVALLDIHITPEIQTFAAQIQALAIACDVTQEQHIAAALQQIAQQWQAPRICVNCAGIIGAKRIVGKQGAMPLADFQRIIEINLIGTFNMLRLVAEQMVSLTPIDADGERGVIINTASIAAYEGQIGQAAYSASKSGIVGLTLPAARELAQFGIRVVTIAPGVFATPMMAQVNEEYRQNLIASVPFPKRLGMPQEYASLVQHIVENTLLNGVTIRLDGGLHM